MKTIEVIELKHSETQAIKLSTVGQEDVVVQFAQDSYGNVEIEAWGLGRTRLFSIQIPNGGQAQLAQANSGAC